MEENTIIEQLSKSIAGASCDIKAEALLLLAMDKDKGLQPEEFLVSCDASFSREFSKDIVHTEIKEDARKKQWLQLHLSRTGLYDQLPEGLFFKPNAKTNGVQDAGYRENKKKEEEIRKFFLPFEHDFFIQRLKVEAEESRMFEGLKSGLLNEYFVQFWDLPANLHKSFAAPLILLIPHAHQIAGNMELTTHSLEQLLKEKVVIQNTGGRRNQGAVNPVIGESILGLDMICGDTFYEDSIILEVSIGPLKNSAVTDYLQGGQRKLLIETFARFFIPAGAEIALQVNVAYERQHMTLAAEEEPVLGYSSVLGKLSTL